MSKRERLGAKGKILAALIGTLAAVAVAWFVGLPSEWLADAPQASSSTSQ